MNAKSTNYTNNRRNTDLSIASCEFSDYYLASLVNFLPNLLSYVVIYERVAILKFKIKHTHT